MDFLSSLILLASSYWVPEERVIKVHSDYCENLYFQPNSEKKLESYWCDIDSVAREVQRVKSGRY